MKRPELKVPAFSKYKRYIHIRNYQDSHEIIEADNLITEEEKEALNQLQDYIALRYAHNNE